MSFNLHDKFTYKKMPSILIVEISLKYVKKKKKLKKEKKKKWKRVNLLELEYKTTRYFRAK